MTIVEELLGAMINAPESRQRDALKLLRGDAVLGNALESSPTKPPLLMGMGEAAKYLGVSRPTLWRIIQAGRLRKVELFPGSYRVRRDDLEELARHRVPSSRCAKPSARRRDHE